MQKFKKYAKKYLLKACIVFLVVVILCISCFIPLSAEEVDYVTNAKFSSLSDIFTGVTSGGWVFDDVNTPPINLSSPFIRSSSRPAQYTDIEIVGDFNLQNIFSNDLYYTITVPLTWYWGNQTAAFVYLSLIDNNGNVFDFETVSQFRPDPLASSTATSTFIFELAISGKNLQEISKFKITVKGRQWHESTPYVYLGLLNNRFITISSMTEYEYNSLYGNKDYDIDTGDTIARVDSIENELFDRADLGSITESVFGSLTWFADISPGIMSAGMIVDELLNFGGINNTWMLNVVRFALMLGVLALFLAIGPGVISKFSSSDRKDGYIKRRKGDDG